DGACSPARQYSDPGHPRRGVGWPLRGSGSAAARWPVVRLTLAWRIDRARCRHAWLGLVSPVPAEVTDLVDDAGGALRHLRLGREPGRWPRRARHDPARVGPFRGAAADRSSAAL